MVKFVILLATLFVLLVLFIFAIITGIPHVAFCLAVSVVCAVYNIVYECLKRKDNGNNS